APAENTLQPARPETRIPLCVDLDGCLVATDTLVESLLKALKKSPFQAVVFLLRLCFGNRAAVKADLSRMVRLDPALLPYRQDFVDHLRAEAAAGRRLYLVTGAHES